MKKWIRSPGEEWVIGTKWVTFRLLPFSPKLAGATFESCQDVLHHPTFFWFSYIPNLGGSFFHEESNKRRYSYLKVRFLYHHKVNFWIAIFFMNFYQRINFICFVAVNNEIMNAHPFYTVFEVLKVFLTIICKMQLHFTFADIIFL